MMTIGPASVGAISATTGIRAGTIIIIGVIPISMTTWGKFGSLMIISIMLSLIIPFMLIQMVLEPLL
jgi:hypothetical protein